MTRVEVRLLGEINSALRRLRGPRPVDDVAVHEARKAMKKARAGLRLVRPRLGEPAYRRQNRALRDAGRCLSPLRDSQTLLDVLDKLLEQHPGKIRRSDYTRLKKSLQARRAKARSELYRSASGIARCIRILENCRTRAEHSGVSRSARDRLAAAARKIYRNGRAALAAARKAPSTANLHECRKQAKYLFNALEMLEVAADKTRARAGELADRLGEEHDLATLAAALETPAAFEAPIARSRARLRKRVIKLAKKLYARKPRAAIPALRHG